MPGRGRECQILEDRLVPDRASVIPPKPRVASVIGFLRGKSAIANSVNCGALQRDAKTSGRPLFETAPS
jgi:hypothetical protein